MEYVVGETVQIPDNGLEVDKFFEWFLPFADVLSHAHEHNRKHRDLKPANIIIKTGGTPKILDFGLARIERKKLVPLYSDMPTMMMDGDVPPSLI
jgi:serine/threonine-protein kinase